MSVDYKEFTALNRKFSRASKLIEAPLKEALSEECARFLTLVKPRTPVDTGHLRASWSVEPPSGSGLNLTAYIVNPVEYARYVEYGTCKYAGAHMAEISMNALRPKMSQRLQAVVLQALQEAKE